MASCPRWVAGVVEGAIWKPPLCRGPLRLESCVTVSHYVLVNASGCGERIVAVVGEGVGDAEYDPEWLTTLLNEPPPPFATYCPYGSPGRVRSIQGVGGSERGFTLQVDAGTARLHARVSRRAEFDNIEFAVLEYLTAAGYKHAPKLHCYTLYEGSQYLVLTDAVEGETAGSLAIRDARPDSTPGRGFSSVLEEIGRAIAALHEVMEKCWEPWCEPEPVGESDVTRWVARVKSRARMLESLHREGLVGDWAAEVADALDSRVPELMEWLGESLFSTTKMRIHGDLHLYQVIVTPSRVYLTDFEGEPYKHPASRLEKETPERDLAALFRSLDYAAALASKRTDGGHAREYSEWLGSAATTLLESYMRSLRLEEEGRTSYDKIGSIISFWMLERASYEVIYEVVAQTGLHGIPAGFVERVISGSDPIFSRLPRAR